MGKRGRDGSRLGRAPAKPVLSALVYQRALIQQECAWGHCSTPVENH